jgi:hypothetical protein
VGGRPLHLAARGLGSGSDLGEAVVVGVALEVVAAGLDLVELLPVVQNLWAVIATVEVAQDCAGLAVDGLSAAAVLLGEAIYFALAAKADGGGGGPGAPKEGFGEEHANCVTGAIPSAAN